jgi:hypothetical protein
MAVVFKVCPLFTESLSQLATQFPKLLDRVEDFKKYKSQNPLGSFGSSDRPLTSIGYFAQAISGIKHAHLTKDISIWYTTSGRDPTEIKLYGVFTHKDSGTGEPPNPKRQKSLASRLTNQSFG